MSAGALPVIDVRAVSVGGATGVAVGGELDLSTAPLLAEALDAAIRETAGTFVVDLTHVAFVDSTGVNVLLRARAALGRADREIVVVCPPGRVRRVLELTGVDDLFATYGTREAAAAALG
jgi:anti-sigma B factor antagonist